MYKYSPYRAEACAQGAHASFSRPLIRLGFVRWLLLSLTSLLVIVAVPVSADSKNEDNDRTKVIEVLDKIESSLDKSSQEEKALSAWSSQINSQKISIAACASEAKKALKKANDDVTSLGEKTEAEIKEVAAKRKAIEKEITTLEKQAANCRLLSLRADELLERISTIQKSIVAARLFHQESNILQVVLLNWRKPVEWITAIKQSWLTSSGLEKVTLAEKSVIITSLIFSIIFSALVRRKWRAKLAKITLKKSFGGRFSLAVSSTVSHYFVQLAVSWVLAVAFYIATREFKPIPFVSVVSYGLPIYFSFVVLIRLFLAPRAPAVMFLDIEAGVAKSLSRRLRVLAMLSFLGFLLFATLFVQSLPEPAIQIARAAFFAVLVLNLIWALWLVGKIQWLSGVRFLRVGLSLVLIAILIVEWFGYRNLSIAAFRSLFGTAMAFGIMSLISRILRESYDGLESGRYLWQRKVRAALGLKSGAHVPGLVWMRLLSAIVLWGMFTLVTLRIFGLSDTAIQNVNLYLVDGFTVGSIHIIPIRFLIALLTFIVLFTLSQWFSTQLDRSWLHKTQMERGAREAMVTISGYLGIAIALLVGLGIAGLDFSNLAIIAGALSVGIGFGLQNVVNNFVSGLILLFERPVKTGDWVVVGNTEGYVRRIRIRSTQIQTFDRADVIVPNSELISNQVTNLMLHDPRGRIRVPIGVAYGSDTQQVREILLSVVQQHEKVINDIINLKPKVLFPAFGDNSLNFELRCHIENIDSKLEVVSDLNFAIDAAFREHNITIPFPQRDVHIIPDTKLNQDNGGLPPNMTN